MAGRHLLGIALGWIVIGLGLGALLAERAAGQDHRNGATWYSRAMAGMDRFSAEELTAIRDFAMGGGGAPSPQMRALLLKAGPILEHFQRGANQPYADFQLDRSEGFFMQLPHLAPLRHLAIVARADAMVRLHDGDTTGAADRIAALYRVGGHVAQDQIAISSLVGQAIFATGDEAAVMAFDRADFSVDETNRLLRAVEALDASDPFQMVGAMVGEQELALTWLGDGTPEQQMSAVEALLGGNPADDERAQGLLAMSPEEYQEQVAQFDHMMDEVIDVFAMEDQDAASAQMQALETELEAGEHGLLSMMFAPAYGKLLERKHQAQALVGARREALEQILEGKVKPIEVANAAVWYLRASEALALLAEEHDVVLPELEIDPTSGLPEQTSSFLLAAQPIIDELHEGSLRRRCNFGRVAGIDEAMFLPPYAAGMRNVFRLLRAETIRQVRAGEIETAVDLFALTYRLIGHLGDDPQMLSAIISHRAYVDTHELLEDADRAGLLDDDRRWRLRSSYERLDRSDPFGYLRARRAAADRLVSSMPELSRFHALHLQAEAADAGPAPIVPSSDELRQLDDDELLSTLAMVDGVLAHWRGEAIEGRSAPAPVLPESAAALADVLALDAWRSLIETIPAVIESIRHGELTAIVPKSGESLNRMTDRRPQARQHLRAGAAIIGLVHRAAPQVPSTP